MARMKLLCLRSPKASSPGKTDGRIIYCLAAQRLCMVAYPVRPVYIETSSSLPVIISVYLFSRHLFRLNCLYRLSSTLSFEHSTAKMIAPLVLIAAALPLALASPISPPPILAGAPIPKPIPASCSLTSPLDGSTPVAPSADFVAANQVYAYYLQSGALAAGSAKLLNTCAESCYGFGTQASCQAGRSCGRR
jgi:hypothetical protein